MNNVDVSYSWIAWQSVLGLYHEDSDKQALFGR